MQIHKKKELFLPNFCFTRRAKNGLKFFWSKIIKIGSITFSITYFWKFLAPYCGMQYNTLEWENLYSSNHRKKGHSFCVRFLIYVKCWPKVNIIMLTSHFIEKFYVQKCLWTFSGLKIFLRTKDTVFWSFIIFLIWKK